MVNIVFSDAVKHPEDGTMDWDLEQQSIDEMQEYGAIICLCNCILEQLNSMGAD